MPSAVAHLNFIAEIWVQLPTAELLLLLNEIL